MANLRIKEIMSERGITGCVLAKAIGTTQANLSVLLSGKHSPSVSSLEKVAEALGVEVWELFEGAPRRDFMAVIKTGDKVMHADSLSSLKGLVAGLETSERV